MRVAVVGSRTLTVPNLEDYLPENASEIISGGARGVDQCARAELVLAFWDGRSRGTVYTIRRCRAMGVPCRVFRAIEKQSGS